MDGDQMGAAMESEEIKLVPGQDWWWASLAVISLFALVFNIIFIVVAIKQRKSRELRSLLTAALLTLSVVDVVDIVRVLSSLVINTHNFTEYRITFCCLSVFHTLAVGLLIILATIYLVFPCRDSPPLYYPASTCSGSLPQKVLLPLVVGVAGGVGSLVYLLPGMTESLTDQNDMVPHSCIDYTRILYLTNEDNEKFWQDLYQSLILMVAVAIPLVISPPIILVASVRSCVKGQCCNVKYKQNAGEMLCVFFMVFFYLGTVVAIVLPRIDKALDLRISELDYAPTLLWELGNAVARPLIYFLCNPGIWDGVVSLCSCRKNRHQAVCMREEEMTALSPERVERVSSL